ncbi:hypothetical protein B7R22_13340 [Subtercola boreus]|uniref:Uncharacterized protein n=1 Tax=Subtercola boreus TaxID=120213 RepID=A0A3E0VVB4_9MICO|nr:hypothetical protein [Subtercola boreus]RFA13630.1 hypothetical protein B7R22_13340 [Subtercola boreus]
MPRRSHRLRSLRSFRLLRVPAVLAIGVVVGTGGVVAAPAPQAQAATSVVSSTNTWIKTITSVLGPAGKVFGFDTAPLDLAAAFIGPLLSIILGDDGGQPKGPQIQDVLDRLEQLNDIENKIDMLHDDLATIQSQILDTDQHVLMGTCTVQTTQLNAYLTKLQSAQSKYKTMLERVEDLRAHGGDGGELQLAVNEFVDYSLGDAGRTAVVGTPLGDGVMSVNTALLTTGGGPGLIKSCGEAYLAAWRNGQAHAGADDAGRWLDDRTYYEPLQNLVEFWQTASAQGAFLVEEAALLKSARTWVGDGNALAPEDQASVCKLALSATGSTTSAKTRAICRDGSVFMQTFYNGLAAEWREVGMPLSNDDMVLSPGSDVTGVVYNNRVVPSTLWARNPSTFPASWTSGTWTTSATPVTVDSIPGFAPATESQWLDLSSGYAATHPSNQPAVAKPFNSWDAQKNPYKAAEVTPFAPVDVLAQMRNSVQPGAPAADGTPTTTHLFDLTGVTSAWIPNQTASHTFPMFVGREPFELGKADGLTFPPSSFQDGFNQAGQSDYVYDDNGLAVKCFVAPVDGVVCNDTVGSWFIARESSEYNYLEAFQAFSVIPGATETGRLVIASYPDSGCFGIPSECAWRVTSIDHTYDLPSWLAPFTTKSGQKYEGDPTAKATLWPVAAVPKECGTTSWGVPTQCRASIDAWLKATIPNPSIPGPVATSAATVSDHDFTDRAYCEVPSWQPNASEAGVAITTGEVTWTGWKTDGVTYTVTTAAADPLALTDFARKAGWYSDAFAGVRESFTLRCSFAARYTDLATETTVQSAVATATRVAGANTFLLTGVGAGDPGAGSGSGSPGTGTGGSLEPVVATNPNQASAGQLAATGSEAGLWVLLAGALALFGVVAALMARPRLRRRR